MAILQKDIEKLAEERDGALKSLEDMKAELAAFQQAAQAAAEDRAAFTEWAKSEIAKARSACPPPESGCSLNVSFTVNADGTTLTGGQLTLRADKYEQASDIVKALDDLMTARKWKVAPTPKAAPPAPPNKAVAILKEAGAAPEVIAAAKQATAHVKETLTVNAVFMTVEPKPGGKVTLNFFGNDRKQPHNQFADLYVTRSAEQLAKDMPYLDPEIFEQAGEYTCSLVVGYVLSDKLNTKGNPYKDVQYIRQAA